MSHSYTKIWIHTIWATKERQNLILPNIENTIHGLIKSQLEELGCSVKAINGMPDHIHCLFLLNPQKSISEVIKTIKGGTSHDINQNDLTPSKFAWQTGYSAFSVSESVLEKVVMYIKNQKEHHTLKSFSDEYQDFLKLYDLEEKKV